MKKIIQTLALLLCLQIVKAETPVWRIKLTIEQKDGTKTVDYISFIEGGISKDSLKNTRYLISRFDRLDAQQQDNNISLFTTRIAYKYRSICDQRTTSDVPYINEVSVPTKLIKKITVQSISEEMNYTEIINNLTSTDTAWMVTKPVKTVSAKGDMCSYELYFHGNNDELAKLLVQLKVQSKKVEESGDSSKVEAIIKKITRFKVVVIRNWTC
ncbi:hypothetical protein [Niastella sp. OAS944]|uniref:hypothetical protein n=1 Tax=Niastella sp. OAS944 TaxID=2664089 RepID=UPI0034754687|nr:hypothetical protein [Chitinophagaceae bacterium OAS944]